MYLIIIKIIFQRPGKNYKIYMAFAFKKND